MIWWKLGPGKVEMCESNFLTNERTNMFYTFWIIQIDIWHFDFRDGAGAVIAASFENSSEYGLFGICDVVQNELMKLRNHLIEQLQAFLSYRSICIHQSFQIFALCLNSTQYLRHLKVRHTTVIDMQDLDLICGHVFRWNQIISQSCCLRIWNSMLCQKQFLLRQFHKTRFWNLFVLLNFQIIFLLNLSLNIGL